jgi:hypothetical protein
MGTQENELFKCYLANVAEHIELADHCNHIGLRINENVSKTIDQSEFCIS